MATKVVLTKSQHQLNKHLSVDKKVQDAVLNVASKIYRYALSNLAVHRKTGSHSIKLEMHNNAKYGHIDHYVVMEGPAPVSLEFGHWDRDKNRYIAGRYIMTIAMLQARL